MREIKFDQFINNQWIHKGDARKLSLKGKIRKCVCKRGTKNYTMCLDFKKDN